MESKANITMDVSRRLLPWLAFLLSGIIPVLLLAPPVFSGHSSFLLWPDAIEQTYAWWQKLATAWHQGHLLLWDPNIYSGRSFVGEIQTSVFYPLTWLWLMLFAQPQGMPRLALEGMIIFHFAIAAMTMWVLLRQWNIKAWPSLAGALCFALFGPVAERATGQANIFFGLSWLPLAVYFASLHATTWKIKYAALAGTVIAVQVLAGHVQPAFHTALICGVLSSYFAYRQRASRFSWLQVVARSGLAMIVPIVIVALPQWLLTAQYLADAYRWVGADAPIGPGEKVPYRVFAREFIISPAQYWSLIDPWRVRVSDANTPHFTVLGVFLGIWVTVSRQRRNSIDPFANHSPWLLGIAAFGIVATLGYLTPLSYFMNKLPLVDQVRQLGRYSILLHFTACIFVAVGLQLLGERPRNKWPGLKINVLFGIAIIYILYLNRFDLMSKQAFYNGGLVLVFLCAVFAPIPRRRWVVVLAGLGVIAYSAWLYRPLMVIKVGEHKLPEQVFATLPLLESVEKEYGLARIAIDESAGLPKNYADTHRLQSHLGYSATMHKPYFDFLTLSWDLVNGENIDLLNVKYLLSRNPQPLPVVAQDSTTGLTLYRRPTAYPRVFLASRIRNGTPESRQPQQFEMLRYDDHEIVFGFALEAADTVVLSEIAYPGWCAELNGNPLAIEHASLDGVEIPLRAVAVPAGEHQLRFQYQPFSSMLGGCR